MSGTTRTAARRLSALAVGFATAAALAVVPAGPAHAVARPAGCQALPTASTVGRPSGLPAPTVITGNYTTTAANQVIDNVTITGRLYIDHPGVTVRNSTLQGDASFAIYARTTGSFTVEDSDIHSGTKFSDGSTMRDVHISALPGRQLTDGLVTRNHNLTIDHILVDGLYVNPGDGAHVDGVQFSGSKGVELTDSLIDASGSGGAVNATVYWDNTNELGQNVLSPGDITMTCNHLVHAPGSYYPLRFENASGFVNIQKNTFGPIDTGAAASATVGVPDTITWSGNLYDDGSTVNVPAYWQ